MSDEEHMSSDEEEGDVTNIGKIGKRYGIVLLILGLYLFFFHRNEIVQWNAAISYFFIAFTGLLIFEAQNMAWKHMSPKFIANGEYTSTTGDYEPFGDFALIRREAVNAMGLKYHTNNGICIVPITSLNAVGKSMASPVRVIKHKLDELPLDIQQYVIEEGLNPPYKMGYADESQYPHSLDLLGEFADHGGVELEKVLRLKKPSISYMIKNQMDSQKMISELQRQLKMMYKSREDIVGHAKRVTSAAKGGTIEKLLRRESRDED